MEEFSAASQKLGGGGIKTLMQSMGLGMIADQVVSAFSFQCFLNVTVNDLVVYNVTDFFSFSFIV